MKTLYTGKKFNCYKILSEHYKSKIKHIGYSEDSLVYYVPDKNIIVKCFRNESMTCEHIVNTCLYKIKDNDIVGLIKPINKYKFDFISEYTYDCEDEYFVFEYPYYKYNLESYFTEKNSMSISTKLNIINQIVSGINQLHSLGFYHGDLKPKNICISEDGETVKIIDFGLSDSIENDNAELYWKNTIYSASPLQLARHIQEYDDYKEQYFTEYITKIKENYNKEPIVESICKCESKLCKTRQVYKESTVQNDWFGVGLLIYYILTNGQYFFMKKQIDNKNTEHMLKEIFKNALVFLKNPVEYCKNKNTQTLIKHNELYEKYLLNYLQI
jgi:serine/threonine protein kinase